MEKTTQHSKDAIIKVVLYGPESTGKSTLAKALAKHYNTSWVPEFARDYLQDKLEQTGEICQPQDIPQIVEGQLKLEEKEAENAKKFLICDTNPLQTFVYTKYYFKDYDLKQLEHLVENLTYELYLLTDIDIPWVADDLRDRPNKRQAMYQLFKYELDKRHLNYKHISGDQNQRLNQAINYIDTLS